MITERLEAAVDYAERGWKVVPLYGTRQPDVCECNKGSKCKTPGKHPRLKEWQNKASSDEDTVIAWFERWPNSNVGVMLGPRSGIIDIEYDSEEGRKSAETLLGDCFTPSFRSSRSVHRLFRWSELLPNVNTNDGKLDINGLELRLGHREKGFQSVFPPSVHGTGKRYTWLDGLSPDEVDIEEVPDSIVMLLQQYLEPGVVGYEKSQHRQKLTHSSEIWEGSDGRNTHLYSEACAQWRFYHRLYGDRVFDDPVKEAEIFDNVWCKNVAKSRPEPLSKDEVWTLFGSAREFLRKETSSEKDDIGGNLTNLGLKFEEGEWWPGIWKVEVVDSEQPEVRLFAPFLRSRYVALSMEDFDNAKAVHLAVLCDTGNVCLDDRPGFWPGIWNGGKGDKKKKLMPSRGLKAKLLDGAPRVAAPAEVKPHAAVAEFILGYVSSATISNSEGVTRLHKDSEGNVMFRFSDLHNKAQFENERYTRNRLSKILRECGVVDERRTINGERQLWMKMPPAGIEALREVAYGDVASNNGFRE